MHLLGENTNVEKKKTMKNSKQNQQKIKCQILILNKAQVIFNLGKGCFFPDILKNC